MFFIVKKIALFLYFTFMSIQAPFLYAELSYRQDFSQNINYGENSQENINKAKILEKYIRNYRNKLSEVKDIYEIYNAPILEDADDELDLMIDGLIKVQSQYVDANDASEIIKSVVIGIKQLNTEIEHFIKKQQEAYKEKLRNIKTQYIIIGNKISKSLLKFIQDLSNVLSKKNTLSDSQKEIVKSLARLNEVRNKIKEFESLRFENTDDMKLYYQDIIKSIRKEVKLIRSLLQ